MTQKLSDVAWTLQDLTLRGDVAGTADELRAISQEAWDAADSIGPASSWHNGEGAAYLVHALRSLAATLWNRAEAFAWFMGGKRLEEPRRHIPGVFPTTRVFVPVDYPKSVDDVRDQLRGTPIVLGPDGRIAEHEEARINAAFARFGLACSRDDDGGRQYINEGCVSMRHKDEGKKWAP